MSAIFKREFSAFFHSLIGYIYIAINIFLIGIYFYAYNLSGCYPDFAYTISSCSYIFLVTIPLLTMRVLAEDRKNKTDQLILTAPVSITRVVLGKFFAVFCVFLIVIAFSCCCPLIMSLYGSIDYGATYLALFGLVLYGAACIAIGVYISSITENIIISAVLTFAIMFVTMLMDALCSIISSTGNLLTKILRCFDIASAYNTFISGTLELTAVIYLLSVTVLMLFLTTQSIHKRRFSVSVKNFKPGAYSLTAIAVTIAATIFLNMIAAKIPEKYTVFDLTETKLYSLTDDTKNLLHTINDDVNIYVYCAEDVMTMEITEILRRYSAESSNVNVVFIDPISNPQFYKEYSSTSFSEGTVIVASSDKFRIISYDELFTYEYTTNSYTYSYDTTITGIDAEGQITSAIAYVTSDESHVIYSTTGHGETSLDATYEDIIKKANLQSSSISLLTEDAVPSDAECLLINAPAEDFSTIEIELIKKYYNEGGNIIVNLLATGNEFPVLWNFLNEYGLTVHNYIVADTAKNSYVQSPFYLLPEISYSTYTSSVYNKYYVFAPYALAMELNQDSSENISTYSLLTTSESSFAKPLDKEINSYEMEEGDLSGPFVISAYVQNDCEDGSTATMVVTGCSNIFTANADQMVANANLTLFTGIVSTLVNIETVVSIPAKSYSITYLTMTQANITTWRSIIMIILPLGIFSIGLIVWLQRRKK